MSTRPPPGTVAAYATRPVRDTDTADISSNGELPSAVPGRGVRAPVAGATLPRLFQFCTAMTAVPSGVQSGADRPEDAGTTVSAPPIVGISTRLESRVSEPV